MVLLEKSTLVTTFQSYNIGLIFLRRLWPHLQNKMPSENFDTHELFFETICFEAESYEEWAEALFHYLREKGKENERFDQFLQKLFDFKKTSLDYEEKPDLPIQDLFYLVIEFVKVYDSRFNLRYALDFLDAMHQEPQSFSEEWKLWEKAISDVILEKRYICSEFFWKMREHLGRFPEYNEESRQAMAELFSSQENLIEAEGLTDRKNIYLKNLSDDRQLWGLVGGKENKVLDFGINVSPNQFLRGWMADPLHENGGYLAALA